jgi:hypothetical protein
MSISTPAGLRLVVDGDNAAPTLRVVLPGRAATDRAIVVLFPEHVTVLRHGRADAEHLYLWRPGRAGEPVPWRRDSKSLSYERELSPRVRLVARATLDSDGVRFRYEFANQSSEAFDMALAVTDPRLTSIFHDPRLERTYVHYSSGLALLAAETPSRLTLPLDRWLPARYLASFTWPVPAARVERREGITHHNTSRAVDQPFIATTSADRTWVVASFARTTGNVWTNPELTCQHVDPSAILPAEGSGVTEMKLLVIKGSVERALERMLEQRSSLH